MQKLIIVLSLLSVSVGSHAAAVQPMYRPITPDSPVQGRGSQFVRPSTQGLVTPTAQSNQSVLIPGVQGVVTPHGQLGRADQRQQATFTGVRPRALVF